MRSGGRKTMIKDATPLIMCLTHCWNNCNNAQCYLDIIDPEHKKISPPPWQEKILKNVIHIFMKKFNRTVTYIALGKNFYCHQRNL